MEGTEPSCDRECEADQRGMLVHQFVQVTQATEHVAKHVLEAHGWDMDAAVSFYLESGGVGHGFGNGSHRIESPPAQQPLRAEDVPRSSPIVVTSGDEEDVEEDDGIQQLARNYSRRRSSRRLNLDEEFEEEEAEEDEDEDVELVEEEDDQRYSLRSRNRRSDRRRLRRNRRRQAAQRAAENLVDEYPDEDMMDGNDIPADVNIEEQKMLMAALTGEAYDGDFESLASGIMSRRTLSPGAVERQQLRAEQDAALQESLAMDQEKERQKELEEKEKMEIEARKKEEEEEKARQLRSILEAKQQALPLEPEAEDPESFVLVIRMPSGSRLKRRFSKNDAISAAFDFIDIESQGSELNPGKYQLVSQFPRRVFQDGDSVLFGESGFTHKQEALFVELLDN